MTEAQLERLRQSRDKGAEQQQASGVAAGKRWALEAAEFEVLERVAALEADDFQDEDVSALYLLWQAIHGDDAMQFQAELLAKEIGGRSNAFVAGFVEGAQEVHDQV